ncbi:CSC1-like protein [Nymphaea thermarum]|nr:CSC1-like protein [Nymphaea thermarum]
MATLQDLAVSAVINILATFASLLAFALLRVQPINDRVYFPKSYINGRRKSTTSSGGLVPKFVNLELMTLLKFLNWMPEALKMSEKQIIDHASVDSAAYLRIYLLGLKMFLPMAFVAIPVLVPVNVSGSTISLLGKNTLHNDIDKLSISNVSPGSQNYFSTLQHSDGLFPFAYRFWFHVGAAYIFTLWTCFLLYKEYSSIASMRLQFLTSQKRRVDQFTAIVRNVPSGSGLSVSEKVEHFFRKHHPHHYLHHQVVYNGDKLAKLVEERESLQNWLDYYHLKFERHPEARPTCRTGFLDLFGRRVDSIDYYKQKIEDLDKKIIIEHQKVLNDPKATLPVAFVSFNSRLGAAICAQTQQCKNPTHWLTDWAPEPRDVYWQNLAIPFVSLIIRRLVIAVSMFALMVFYMIPIAFAQSLANLDGLAKVAPFLRPVNELCYLVRKVIKSFLQGFLPGFALKIFLFFLPTILTAMSTSEGHVSLSKIDTIAAAKHYYFMLVNVFLGSIVSGTAFQQLSSFLHQAPSEIAKTIGVSVPTKATFFITYIMLDGWSAIAAEILRPKSLAIHHLQNMFLIRTEKDREQAMEPGNIGIAENLPRLQLYFLLGLVYAVVSPILLPFVIIFFGLGFLVYRHQVPVNLFSLQLVDCLDHTLDPVLIINVYDPHYESIASFWPHVHERIITSLITSHFHLIGLLSTKKAPSTPLLIILPILTIWFRNYCKKIFEPTFTKHPVEVSPQTKEAAAKDAIERAAGPDLHLRPWLADAYLHPVLRVVDDLGKRGASTRRTEDSEPISRAANDLGHQREASSRRADYSPSSSISELSSPSPQYYVSRHPKLLEVTLMEALPLFMRYNSENGTPQTR